MKFEKQKIVLVIPTFVGGGMERVMSELAKYLNDQDIEIHVLFLVDHKPFYIVNRDIKLYFPKLNDDISDSRGLLYWLKIIKYLRKTIIKINPSSVFSIPQGYSNLTILALLGTSFPIYISDRNSPNKPVSLKLRLVRKLFYPLATGIVAQTEYAKQNLLNSGIKNKNIVVIPNPLKKIHNYGKKSPTEKKTILNIGR